MSSSTEPARAGALAGWGRLVRLPAPLLAPADVLAGWALAGCTGVPHPGALAASALLCAAGMALNDVADRDRDRIRRPERPIPMGEVGAAAAGVGGAMLVAGGVACAWTAGPAVAVTAGALALAIVAYDFALKGHALGAGLAIAAARAANLLIGAAAAGGFAAGTPRGHVILGAALIGTYAAGLIAASAAEDGNPPRWARLAALAAMVAAALGAGMASRLAGDGATWEGLVASALLVAWLAAHATRLLRGPAGAFVGAGVLGYPLLDAALAASAGRRELALAAAALFAVGLAIRRWRAARVD